MCTQREGHFSEIQTFIAPTLEKQHQQKLFTSVNTPKLPEAIRDIPSSAGKRPYSSSADEKAGNLQAAIEI